jgi:drug/metabolite transporter (DMT)-like permease
MERQGRAYLNAAAAVLLWSTVATAFKLSLRALKPPELLLWANVVSLLTLLGILAARGRLGELRRLPRRQLLQGLGLGVLNPFLYYLVLFWAYALLPAQEAQPLNYTWAVTLTLLSVPLLGQRVGLGELGAIGVAYAGVVVIATRGDLLALQLSDPLGVALALGSTLLWSLFWIGNARSTLDPTVGLTLNFAASLPLSAGAALLLCGARLPAWPGLLGAAYVGLFEMGITFVLWLRALRLTETTARISRLIFFSPFLSLVLIHFVLGEAIRPSSLVGLALIVAGNALQQLLLGRRSAAARAAEQEQREEQRQG